MIYFRALFFMIISIMSSIVYSSQPPRFTQPSLPGGCTQQHQRPGGPSVTLPVVCPTPAPKK